MTSITGRVLNWDTTEPVAGATVSLFAGNLLLSRGAADSEGVFALNTTGVPDSLEISSAGFTTRRFSWAEYESFWTFFLRPYYREGETAVVHSTIKKTNWLPLAFLFVLLFSMKNKN